MDAFGNPTSGYGHHNPAVQQASYPPPLSGTGSGYDDLSGSHPSSRTPSSGSTATNNNNHSNYPAVPGTTTTTTTTTRGTGTGRKPFGQQVREYALLEDVPAEIPAMPKVVHKGRTFVLERWLQRSRARTSFIVEHGEFLMEITAGGEPMEPVWACTVPGCKHDLFSAKASSAAIMHLEKVHGIAKAGAGRKRPSTAVAAAEMGMGGSDDEDGAGMTTPPPPKRRAPYVTQGSEKKEMAKVMRELGEERARNAGLREELDQQRRRYEDEIRQMRDRHAEEMRAERERFSKSEDRLWAMIDKIRDE